jgi:hypothetical protein
VATAYFQPGGWLSTFWSVQWFAGAIPVILLAPLLIVASREGNWPRRKTFVWATPLIAWALLFVAAQSLSMWALQQRLPALVLNADGIRCAPWQETTRWENVTSLSSYDEKAGSGWKMLGITLQTRPQGGRNLRPREYNLPALQWGIRFAHCGVFGQPEAAVPCGTRGLDHDPQALVRLIQEVYFKLGARVDAKFRARNRCWVHWCLTNKGLDHLCVANMPGDISAEPCLARIDH